MIVHSICSENTATVLKELQVDDLILERKHKRPKRIEDGAGDAHFHDDPKTYYRVIYFQCLDVSISPISQQKYYSVYVNLEQP